MVPKFRGKTIKGFLVVGYVSVVTDKRAGVDPGTYISNDIGLPFAYEVDPETVGQSTEMDDKTGKEIWHKDILDESYTSPLNGEEVIVRYIVEKENGMWKLKDWKGRQQYDRYLFMRNKQCVKIGNVFQNPELLEG